MYNYYFFFPFISKAPLHTTTQCEAGVLNQSESNKDLKTEYILQNALRSQPFELLWWEDCPPPQILMDSKEKAFWGSKMCPTEDSPDESSGESSEDSPAESPDESVHPNFDWNTDWMMKMGSMTR